MPKITVSPKKMKRPNIEDKEFMYDVGFVLGWTLDWAAYCQALEKYIDYLEHQIGMLNSLTAASVEWTEKPTNHEHRRTTI